ncbi:hypothetical protein CI109_103165 [Kwoniella shandongensis]|uniref:Uncharacterized protein n=1 Tax=Kwoniella shandongensis TaxID=1734106 RepID=A0A5M6C8U6_9TREE|nr:uncharacterized protein CI109_000356 [Kwoniella shandongensis]KAA5531514.1 hypothetical protein CI109_000356 [Kwoniella shandongensis]
MRSTLTDLPVELLQQIHLLALNPFLPLTSTYIHSILHHPSPSYVATYLLALYSDYGPNEILVRALRHPVCTIEVAKDIQRIWDRRRGYIPPIQSTHDDDKRRRHRHRTRSISLPLPVSQPTAPELTCRELPRRLFRPSSSSPSSPVHPLIHYLFDQYSPSPNSHKGYPLCRAAFTSNYDLASYLLHKGADPAMKDCLAVEIAISNKDIKMVRLLVERDPTDCLSTAHASNEGASGVVKGENKMSKKVKKVKLGDRIEIGTNMVETAMKKGSKEIVNYFVYEKKVMPPLQSIMKLSKSEPIKVVKLSKRKNR